MAGGTIVVVDDIDLQIRTGKIILYSPNSEYSYTLQGVYTSDSGIQTSLFSSSKSLGGEYLGRVEVSFGITSSEAEAVLTACPTKKTVTISYTLTTYMSGESIGTSTGSATVFLTDTAKPDIYTTTFSERNPDISGVGTRRYLQNISIIRITFGVSMAVTGSTLKKLQVTLGGKTYTTNYTSGLTAVEFTPDFTGTFTPVCIATDSRGFSTSYIPSESLTILPYYAPKVSSYTIGRVNNTGTTVEVLFEGSVASVINSTERNTLTSAVISGAISPQNVTFTTSGTAFSANTVLSGTFVENANYPLFLTLTDNFGSETVISVKVPKSRPVLALRDGSVGINTSLPSCALDVRGVIEQNEAPIMGYRSAISNSTNFNTLYGDGNNGIYITSAPLVAANRGPDIDVYGVLEVISDHSGRTFQRFTSTDPTNAMWIRSRVVSGSSPTWTSWTQI